MASASAIRAAEAYTEFTVRDGRLRSGLSGVRRTINGFLQSLRGAAGPLAAIGLGSSFGSGIAGAAAIGSLVAVSGPAGATAAAIMALGAAFMKSVSAAATLEQALAELRSVANPTAKEFGLIKSSVNEISQELGIATVDVTAGLTELLRAGVSAKSVMDGTGGAILKFARVNNLDVPQAAITAANAMNNFGESVQDTTNIITAAADSSSTDANEMVLGFAMAAAQAQRANWSLRDLSIAMALMAQGGIKGSDAGTSLKTMLASIMAPSERGKKVLEQIGLKIRDLNGALLPARALVENFTAAMGKLNQEQKDAVLEELFGRDASRAIFTLTKTGTTGWDQMNNAMNRALTVEQKYAITTDTLTGAWNRLTASVGRFAEKLGAVVSPTIRGMVGALNDLIETLDKALGTIQDAFDPNAKANMLSPLVRYYQTAMANLAIPLAGSPTEAYAKTWLEFMQGQFKTKQGPGGKKMPTGSDGLPGLGSLQSFTSLGTFSPDLARRASGGSPKTVVNAVNRVAAEIRDLKAINRETNSKLDKIKFTSVRTY